MHPRRPPATADAMGPCGAPQARDFSLDRMRDGPFARLAKENDIMWKYGGRPDDTTVIGATQGGAGRGGGRRCTLAFVTCPTCAAARITTQNRMHVLG
jgi:hypothetical protein